jgi:hypothetical protein
MAGWEPRQGRVFGKVNRCLAEGRRAFIERYEGIESGAECERLLPLISAMVDGEATQEQLLELRPHLRNCPGCRATLRALRDSSKPLAALLPVPLVVVDGGSGDHVLNMLMRLYEGMAGGLHERAVHSVTKAQALIEATAAGKVAAVAASAAAVAGGGYASVERIGDAPPAPRVAAARVHVPAKAPAKAAAPLVAVAGRPVIAKRVAEAPAAATPPPPSPRGEFGASPSSSSSSEQSGSAPEFQPTASAAASPVQAQAAQAGPFRAPVASPGAPPAQAAPEFSTAGATAGFGP